MTTFYTYPEHDPAKCYGIREGSEASYRFLVPPLTVKLGQR